MSIFGTSSLFAAQEGKLSAASSALLLASKQQSLAHSGHYSITETLEELIYYLSRPTAGVISNKKYFCQARKRESRQSLLSRH
eukprot:scaffold25012_cov71-Skeletonema_marinoi.AAC.1